MLEEIMKRYGLKDWQATEIMNKIARGEVLLGVSVRDMDRDWDAYEAEFEAQARNYDRGSEKYEIRRSC